MKLSTAAFALAFGIWWSGGIFILTWWLILTGVPAEEVGVLRDVYPGYAVTPVGSFIRLISGFICAAIYGAILASLYNFLADRIESASAQAPSS